jgi:hypothetical protein|tara:strand:- start:249 stop:455 length:207 start_codon:yes stop_codon:yes gene_type:complete
MKKQESLARRECANYNNGNCLGIMFSREDGKLTTKIDGKFAGKKCIVDTNNCSYFNQIVIKGGQFATR